MTETYTLLAVCTGNICRSPAMDRLLVEAVGEDQIDVRSAGTHAHVGDDMEPQMKERLDAAGADTADFQAVQLSAEMVRSSDLVLTASHEHVEDILTDVPDSAQKVFTLREFTRLLDAVDEAALRDALAGAASTAEKLTALVPLVAAQRDHDEAAGQDDDVVDPYMMPDDVFDASFAQIREPVERLREVLEA